MLGTGDVPRILEVLQPRRVREPATGVSPLTFYARSEGVERCEDAHRAGERSNAGHSGTA